MLDQEVGLDPGNIYVDKHIAVIWPWQLPLDARNKLKRINRKVKHGSKSTATMQSQTKRRKRFHFLHGMWKKMD